MVTPRTGIVKSKGSKYHEAEDLQAPIFQLSAQVTGQIERLRKMMIQDSLKDSQEECAQDDFEPPFSLTKTKEATFEDFLIDQYAEIPDGTQQNILLDRHLNHFELQYSNFLRLLISALRDLQIARLGSTDFSKATGCQVKNDLVLGILEALKNLTGPDARSGSTFAFSVQRLSSAVSELSAYLQFRGKGSEFNNQISSYNWLTKAKNANKRLAKILEHSKYIAGLTKVLNSCGSEEDKVAKVKAFEISNAKAALSVLIQEFIKSRNAKTQVCLNCENRVVLGEMDNHINSCKMLYARYEEVVKIDAQLNGRLQDLQSLSVSIRKVRTQKRKQLEFSGKSNKPKPFANKFSKSLYDKRNRSEYLLAMTGKGVEEDQQTFLQCANEVCISDLTYEDLTKYLEIVDDLKRFILGMRDCKRRHLSSCIYNQLKEFKEELRDNYDHLESADIVEIVRLLIAKFKALKRIQEMEARAKSPEKGFTKFQREYQHMSSIKSESIIQENHSENDAYSDDESEAISSLNNSHVCLKDFKVVRLLAQGKYGKVYLVKKKATGVKYAMKQVRVTDTQSKSELEKLANENDTFSIVNSDFLVKAVFSFATAKHHYFVMEYASNGDFADKLGEEERLFEYEARPLLAQIAMAINTLHELGIIHRDIKPQNIVIDSDGHLKLTDYGLSETYELRKKKLQEKSKAYSRFVQQKILDREAKKEQPRRVEKIVGSPYYMAPEVVSFEPITKMSDWWSFGIIVYQTLVGEPPFLGKNFSEIAEKIEKGNIWWTNEIVFGDSDNMISYEAKDLIERLLSASPDKRLGHKFEEIRQHKFFTGLNWECLRSTPSPIEVFNEQSDEEQQQLQAKDCFGDEETSSHASTCSNMNLIRRDILAKETKISYYKHLGAMIHLHRTAERLRNEAKETFSL